MKNTILILLCTIIFFGVKAQSNLESDILSKIETIKNDPVQNLIAQESGWFDQMNKTLQSIRDGNIDISNSRTNDNCSSAEPICLENTYIYPLATATQAEAGPEYGCLSTTPNPIWYYIKIEGHTDGSDMGYIELSLTAEQDIDFIIWGPFDDATCDNNLLTGANIVDCSYSSTSNETPLIPNTISGKYYMMLITNFANVPQNFLLQTTGGTAYTDCSTLFNVTGNVYLDIDDNCESIDDEIIENVFVRFDPGPYFASVNPQGEYAINLPVGTYDYSLLSPLPTPNITDCDTTIDVLNDTTDYSFDLPILVETDNDPTINITCPTLVNDSTFYVNISNYGINTSSGTITIHFDQELTVISASIPYINIDDHTIELEYSDLNFLDIQSFTVTTNSLDLVSLIGYTAVSTAEIFSNDVDVNLDNNISIDYTTVLLAYDPNNISASPRGYYDSNTIGLEEREIVYTINFQNTGNAPASYVYIRDEIPTAFKFNTIQLLASSHDCELEIESDGVVKLKFNNINLIDSVANESESHGWVSFKVDIGQELAEGDVILNHADIFFDNNPAVITNVVELVVESIISNNNFIDSGISLFPNPVNDKLFIISEEKFSVKIFNIMGKTVYSENDISDVNLNVKEFTKGVYFIQVNKDGKNYTEKLIIE